MESSDEAILTELNLSRPRCVVGRSCYGGAPQSHQPTSTPKLIPHPTSDASASITPSQCRLLSPRLASSTSTQHQPQPATSARRQPSTTDRPPAFTSIRLQAS
ncbi:hypothetical protein BDP55DRAFT_116834 [Colletotrichum godetiae]|uniref:Uncharacterized protein n=1 Tax=Colletotrichum godetiae TaxID=1209918 RepID=A0AAJ0EY80_9PEZI|nr:uncharacterized protein BDP55DRAFT_116834 [Colletotrichum godetiae]KAK1675909.1 hypothetical protein BDP55DRAFT_116834 [Colletotrichum godetiae]